MHVKRICVSRYGPLKPFDADIAPFTVLQGPNERGKTLLIDALVRMLFKDHLKRGQYKLFGNLNRVDERPEGFLVMTTHAGEVKVGAEESIADVSPVEITPEDFRNVFLIRDSDLSIKDQEAYYGRVSEKLCGTRFTAIDGLKDALKRIGRLRSARPDSPLAVRKDRDQRRIGEQVAAAEKLIDRMVELGGRLEREGFDEATRRLADLVDTRAALDAELRRLRAAETRERLNNARAAADAARKELAELAALDGADDGLLENWRALLVRREVFEKELADTLSRGGDLRAARDQATTDWETMRATASEKEASRARVDDELRPLLERHRAEKAFREHADRSTPAMIGVLAAAVVLGVGAVIAALVTRSPVALGAVFACVGAAAWSGVALARGARDRARLTRERAAALAVAARSGIAAGTIDEAEGAVDTLEREAMNALARARESEVLMRQRETDVAANDSAAADARARLLDTQAALDAMRGSTGCDSVEQMEAAVQTRRSLENGVGTRLALLRSWLPGAARAADREGFLRACDAEIARGIAELPEDAGASNPEAARRVEQQLAGVSLEERNLRQQCDRARQDLGAIEVRVADLGTLEAPVHCRTTRELADARRRLAAFCETVQRDARLAKEAIRIVQEIEAEENEKVGELFGENTLVSRWFREITSGAYRAVHLEDGDVRVEQNDGHRLSASALSGGTFDQLYLAIRASIAERMLPESKGFFILDDPFLKADRERMRALMKMLRHLVGRGWQVIYVTAKDEVLEALRADIAAGSVRLIELERSLFARGAARAAADLSDAPRLL